MFDKISEDNLNLSPVDKRWSWAQVDLNSIRHNVRTTKNFVGSDVKILAIVKANAYGHGAPTIAKTALNSGATYLGVASVDEGIHLRQNGITAPILVLSQPPESSVQALVHHELMPSIYTPDFAICYAEAADAMQKTAPFHLVINTGMNRIGVKWDEAAELLYQISFHRALECCGTFTHFATADCSEELDFRRQLDRFNFAIDAIRQADYNPGIVHAANSAATFRYPETHFDMVRLGIAMYGYHPCPQTQRIVELKPALSIHARITDERILGVGEGVSYEMNYRARGAVKICTLPIGYADGLRRSLSGKISVLYKGRKFPQVGNICMDQCMFEIDMNSGVAQQQFNAQIGEEVVLLGVQDSPNNIVREEITLEELADIAQTNTYELACGFNNRMPIIYV